MRRPSILATLTVALAVGAANVAEGQSLADRLKKRAEEAAKRKVEQRVDQRAGQATDAALDKAEGTVKCAAADTKCIDKAKAEGKTVDTSGGGAAAAAGAAAAPAGGASSEAAAALKPGEGAWANYDFKPGDRILYFDDFTKDEVGDFPRRMEFKAGALEIVEWQGARWLRASEDSRFFIGLPEVLPQRYTIEFDFAVPGGTTWIFFGEDQNKRVMLSSYYGQAEVYNHTNGVHAKGDFATQSKEDRAAVRRARLLVDGNYMKVYVGDKRILNVPNAEMERTNKIGFWTDASTTDPAMFGNFRIAAGGKKLYDALTESGRVATQGIYFDTGSDRVRPESSPTLKEIATMLKEHEDLRLTIEGHTDNVGAAAANQTLSEKRAAAVKAALVSSYGVDAARLESKGLGASKPAAKNDTAEGRQTNRRVELVKM